jgi:hypothetical protein
MSILWLSSLTYFTFLSLDEIISFWNSLPWDFFMLLRWDYSSGTFMESLVFTSLVEEYYWF